MFFRLFDGLVVNLHLLGIKGFQPCVLFDVAVDEPYGLFPFDLHGCFSLFTVVEPGFRPPPDAGPVRIDRYCPGNVEALDVNVQFRQRVDDISAFQGFVIEFFFMSTPMVDRYTSCRRVR